MFLSVWTEDAKYLIGGPFGDHVGIDAINSTLHGLWTAFTEMHHRAINVIIEIGGDSARTWVDADVTGSNTKDRALMFAASYEDQLRRIDGA